ncbi:ribonuclease P protein component [bacterium]|nr:ribonuclease P protein component [bacterium]
MYQSSFIFFYLPADELKVGVVASKKTIGNAIKRNRARRRLKEVLRLAIKEKIFFGRYILVAKKPVLGNTFDLIQQELIKCLKSL